MAIGVRVQQYRDTLLIFFDLDMGAFDVSEYVHVLEGFS